MNKKAGIAGIYLIIFVIIFCFVMFGIYGRQEITRLNVPCNKSFGNLCFAWENNLTKEHSFVINDYMEEPSLGNLLK